MFSGLHSYVVNVLGHKSIKIFMYSVCQILLCICFGCCSIGGKKVLSQSKNPVYSCCQDGIRRGRPRADTVRELISEGETSSSRIRCNICNRVFPREKSLQAHKRTHTGERDREAGAVNIYIYMLKKKKRCYNVSPYCQKNKYVTVTCISTCSEFSVHSWK